MAGGRVAQASSVVASGTRLGTKRHSAHGSTPSPSPPRSLPGVDGSRDLQARRASCLEALLQQARGFRHRLVQSRDRNVGAHEGVPSLPLISAEACVQPRPCPCTATRCTEIDGLFRSASQSPGSTSWRVSLARRQLTSDTLQRNLVRDGILSAIRRTQIVGPRHYWRRLT